MNLNNINNSSVCAILNTQGEFISFSKKYQELAEVNSNFIGQDHFSIFNKEPKNKEIFIQVVNSGIPQIIHSKTFTVNDTSNQCGNMGSWILLPIFDSVGYVSQVILSYIHIEETDYIHNLKVNIDHLTSLYNRKGIEKN